MNSIAGQSARLLVLLCLLGASACDAFAPDGPAEDQLLDGTIEGMPASQVRQHLVGDEEFIEDIDDELLDAVGLSRDDFIVHVHQGREVGVFSNSEYSEDEQDTAEN